MPGLPPALRLAEEVGEKLGGRPLLQRALSALRET